MSNLVGNPPSNLLAFSASPVGQAAKPVAGNLDNLAFPIVNLAAGTLVYGDSVYGLTSPEAAYLLQQAVEAGKLATEVVDIVNLSSTTTASIIAKASFGKLYKLTVTSGTGDVTLLDGAGVGTSQIRTMAAYTALPSGTILEFPRPWGFPFINALTVQLSGTLAIQMELA